MIMLHLASQNELYASRLRVYARGSHLLSSSTLRYFGIKNVNAIFLAVALCVCVCVWRMYYECVVFAGWKEECVLLFFIIVEVQRRKKKWKKWIEVAATEDKDNERTSVEYRTSSALLLYYSMNGCGWVDGIISNARHRTSLNTVYMLRVDRNMAALCCETCIYSWFGILASSGFIWE